MVGHGRDRTEKAFLFGSWSLVILLLVAAWIAGLVTSGDTQHFDERVLRALRRPDDPTLPIGPVWLRFAALDVTALGGATVLGLGVLATTGFLLLQGLRRTALFVLVASVGVWFLNSELKEFFGRPRPSIVPHLSGVLSLSFPSGHAMNSAAVYLTIGALLMRITDRRALKVYSMGVAMLLVFLIGVSRLYLGVHYPTDVLAGWVIGMSWAVLCWLVERWIEHRSGLDRRRHQGLDAG